MKQVFKITLLLSFLTIMACGEKAPVIVEKAQSDIKERIELKHGSHGKRTDEQMQSWRNNALGQFIHWGVYSIPGGEWNGKKSAGAAEWFRGSGLITTGEYDSLYKQFNPVKYNATQWAKQAKEMGAKYLIFTTKHHDGFCMWPSKYTDYTIANTPFKRDIVKEIVDAYTAENIDVHLYFSIIDWSHPGYYGGGNINNDIKQRDSIRKVGVSNYNAFKSDEQKAKYETFKEFTRNQLLELLENYPTIKGLWFDGSWDIAWVTNAAWVDSLGAELREKHPGLIIGSRFRSDEFGYRHVDSNGELIDDYDQRYERSLPKNLNELNGRDWDCVMTVPENQWGFHRDWSLSYVKTPYELIEMVVQANALNGNLVINFGPDGEGNIRAEEAKIAKEVGAWMTKYGEAIYGDVRNSILDNHEWGYSTQKGDNIYLVVFNKPLNNKIRVKVPRAKQPQHFNAIENATFLHNNKPAKVQQTYRDKGGNYYFDIDFPKDVKEGEPFVIKINIKEVDLKDRAEYQQALT